MQDRKLVSATSSKSSFDKLRMILSGFLGRDPQKPPFDKLRLRRERSAERVTFASI